MEVRAFDSSPKSGKHLLLDFAILRYRSNSLIFSFAIYFYPSASRERQIYYAKTRPFICLEVLIPIHSTYSNIKHSFKTTSSSFGLPLRFLFSVPNSTIISPLDAYFRKYWIRNSHTYFPLLVCYRHFIATGIPQTGQIHTQFENSIFMT